MIKTAIEAAKQAGNLALEYFIKQPKINFKPDKSPVTIADKKAEKLARRIIGQNFPKHGIIGEEFPAVNPASPYQWIIDPIDGTRDFTRNLKTWATFVALLKDNRPILGVIYYPTENEMFSAQKGKGAFLNGEKTQVSKINKIEDSLLIHENLKRFAAQNLAKGLINLSLECAAAKNLGPYGINAFLKGNAEILVNSYGSIWDLAAPAILIEEAGGKFTDFSGKYSLTSGNYVAANGPIHTQVLNLLNS